MSQEQLMTSAQLAVLLPPKEILDITEESSMNRTLTLRPLDKSGRVQKHLHMPHKRKRVAGLNRGMISMSEDFDAPLPDEFWLGQE